ncbi:MAG: VWA domain-containing protein [Bacteroidetes bacterium]|mgnify:FL=1|jgi:Ca-activated chloride channel family protein|nr:VWA domain-containing protein [Bacteroidota bacterium]MBK7041420.1 VWA domain-containing protein [Bacteroidota bacterium]MBK7587947.1 VWA domain-containing protein [Bacteroidota bacterium]MBK8330618.1 VWA domain-containing protein [Bacteroidota bacterium]MBK9301783.1 VWA domain-containing protein [Bacteroidota bacterium]
MQKNSLWMTLFITGLASVLSLSSFYKPQTQQEFTSPNDDNIEYNGQSKQSKSRGNITLSGSFENDYYTSQQKVGYFYAEVQAGKYENNNASRRPLNISLVIDRSGSMAGEKIRNAKKAAKYVIDQMQSDDYLSVVIYDGTVDLLQDAVHPYNKQMIKNKIDAIQDRGGTNLMGGAMKGYTLVKKNYQEGYINRVLLLSDGLANEGITDPKQIERIVRKYNNEDGITISTFGVGADYNEDLMTAMAETGMGNYYFINDAENIAGIFKKELNGLMEVVAQQAILKITIPDYINVEKVYGYNYDQMGRTLTIKFHDIFSEETKGVLIKYSIGNRINQPITFEASLGYTDLSNERKERMAIVCKSDFTNNINVYNQHFSDWVSTQVAIYVSNDRLETAMKEVDKGNYNEAKKIVQENKDYISSKPQLLEKSVELRRVETTNMSYDMNVDAAPTMAEEERKVMQKASKSENYQIRTKKK